MTTTSTKNWIVTSGGPAPEVPDLPLPRTSCSPAGPRTDRRSSTDRPGAASRTGSSPTVCGVSPRGSPRAVCAQGDAVALLAPNLPEWLVAAYGVMAAGGVVTGVNPLCTAGEVAGQLADADARFLVTVPPFLPAAREAVARAGTPRSC